MGFVVVQRKISSQAKCMRLWKGLKKQNLFLKQALQDAFKIRLRKGGFLWRIGGVLAF